MADDITLTVRVRDMTRGEFNQIRQRMRGMDGDFRRVAQSTSGASSQAQRMGQEVTRLGNRLGHLQHTGSMANEEMVHMRRTMSLLGRDLRSAARDGNLTEDQFKSLSRQLERTRLDFDYLTRDIDRHSARANRAARDSQRRQSAAQRMGQTQARALREDEQRIRRAGQLQTRALREDEQRIRRAGQLQTRALREDEQRTQRRGQLRAAAQRMDQQRDAVRQQGIQRMGQLQARAQRDDEQRLLRMGRMRAAAQREDIARTRRAEAERSRLAAQEVARQQRDAARLAALGGMPSRRPVTPRVRRIRQDDQGLTLRFRALGENDMNQMTRGFANLQRSMAGISGSSERTRRTVRALSGDLRTMARALQDAGEAGSLSRRDFNALSNGLRVTVRDSRQLVRSGDMTRSAFRDMRSEVTRLQAQLRLLGNEGNVFQRLDSRLLLFQRRLRDTRSNGNILRRSMNRMGDGLAGGLRGGIIGTGLLINGMRRLGERIKLNKRWTLMLVAALLLLGPAAQAIGALLIAVLGAAFIALGALALKNSATVKRAFQEMKSTVASSVREAAQPMEEHLVAGIHQVGIAVKQMQPLLTAAFAATGPLIQDFVGAFTDLAGMSMPGIITALRDMGPAMEGFRTAMGVVGQGFGDMFAAMTADGGAEALRDVWITLGRELANLLVGIGEFVRSASQSGTATMILVGVFRTLSGILNIVQVGLATVDVMFGGLFQHLNQNVIDMDHLASGVEGVGTAFVTSGQSAADLKKQLADVNKEITRIKEVREAEDMLLGMPDAYYEHSNATEGDLTSAQSQRKALLEAIAAAEMSAAGATAQHAGSISNLIAKVTALNDINRSNLDARAGQEKAIDDAAKLAKNTAKYSESLKMVKGQLDLNGESGREAYEVLSRIAQTTKESTDAAVKSKAPWDQVRAQWQRGYDQIVKLADGMGLSKSEAKALADQIVGIPNKEIFLQARTEQVKADLDSVIAAMQAAPNEKTITVTTLTADSITALKNLGFTVEQLPDGSFTVTAETGTAKSNIGKVQGARDALKSKKITMSAADASTGVINAIKELVATLQDKTITITTRRVTVLKTLTDPGSTAGSLADALRKQAKNARGATGGLAERLSRFADGGSISGDVLDGPGSKTSDSLTARLSRGEFVMRASAVDKYGPSFMKRINEGRFPRFAKGGVVSEAKQARSPIKAATSGTTEKNLLRLMSSIIKHTVKMATALKSVNSALEKAKSKLSSLKSSASSLSGSVKSGVMSATNVTSGVEAGKHVTVSSVMGKLRSGRDKATAFASALKRLRKRGLAKGLLRQIAEAGIEGGGMETAGALLRASGSELKSANSFHAQTSSAASSAGKTTADAVYAKQIKVQEKLVKALDELSKALKKSVKKKAVGGAVGAASGGARGGLTWVGELGPELVRLPSGSSVSSNADSRRMAGLGAGSGGSYGSPTILHVYIGEKKVDEIVLDSNRRTVRTRGGNVQKIFSQK